MRRIHPAPPARDSVETHPSVSSDRSPSLLILDSRPSPRDLPADLSLPPARTPPPPTRAGEQGVVRDVQGDGVPG